MTRYYLLSALLFICLSAISQDDLTISDPVFGKVEVSAPNSVTLSPGFHAVEGSDFRAYIGENQSVSNTFNTAVTEHTVAGVPSDDENFIKSITYREPSTTKLEEDFKHLEQIQYFDGLGRLKQTIQVNASPSGFDIIQPVVYDDFDRESDKYLPYTAAGNGEFRDNAAIASLDYYNTLITGKEQDADAYLHFDFDNSPLNRVMKQFGPGEAWHENDGKPVTYGYTTNAEDVTNWSVNEEGVFTEDNYPAYSLYITETTDEEGNTTREYKDKQGKVVQKESELEDSWLRTLYIYDDFGLLRCVVPPKATSPDDEELCYYYTYDHRNRMIGKKLPGAEPVCMVYDKRDNLVLVQDGKTHAENANLYYFTKYDVFSRPVLTGKLITTVSLSDIRDDFMEFEGAPWEYFTTGTGNCYFWSNESFPSGYTIIPGNVLTVTYYDNYVFVDKLDAGTDYNSAEYDETGFTYTPSERRKGLVTGSMTRVLPVSGSPFTIADEELYSVNYYDNYGNVIRAISDNHKDGKDVVSTNFKPVTFEVESTLQLHTGIGDDLKILKNFTYDHAGRLLKTTQQINDEDEITLNAMVYNELGELVTKYLHSVDAGDSKNFLQKTDYTYNVRGWLRKINDPALSDDNDVFGMELFYSDITGLNSLAPGACYNGNIAGMKWSANGDLIPLRAYGFSYDGLNRLKTSSYAEGAGLADNTGYYNENITEYDANGNIVKLNRSFGADLVDDLTYNYYSGSNQIQTITDDGVTSDLVDDYLGNGGTYSYDQNGNMTHDGDKLLTVAYNHLNLPQSVAFGGDNNIFYHYSATGAKLVKYVDKYGGTDAVTHYIGNIVYNGNEIAYILTEEGRIVPYGTGSERQWLSEYHLKDHLGNTRAVISGNSPGGAVEILQLSSYYPFGMPFAMKEFGAIGNEYANNKYLYNGKELQDDMLAGKKLDWYDYGARMYDAQLGRWHVVDPLEQYDSPYIYAGNNPIIMFDPSGMWTIDRAVIDPSGRIIYWDPWDPDKNIYLSLDGIQGADGNTDGLPIVGKEQPGVNYFVGTYISNFRYNTMNESHKIEYSYAALIEDGPIISVSPEQEIIELVFTGGGLVLIKKGGKWIVKKFTKELGEEIIEEAGEKGIKILIRNKDSIIKSATEITGTQGLTNVGRALQKHAGRQGSVFSLIKFSHKSANDEGLKILKEIMSSKHKIIQKAENGGTLIFDKTTGRGFGISRSGQFNGFRDLN